MKYLILHNLYTNSLESRDTCPANCASRDACPANCVSRDACQANCVVQTVPDDRISSTRRRMAARYRLPTPCNVYSTSEADGPRVGGVTCNCVVPRCSTDGRRGRRGRWGRRGRRPPRQTVHVSAVSRVTSAKMFFAGFASSI